MHVIYNAGLCSTEEQKSANILAGSPGLAEHQCTSSSCVVLHAVLAPLSLEQEGSPTGDTHEET